MCWSRLRFVTGLNRKTVEAARTATRRKSVERQYHGGDSHFFGAMAVSAVLSDFDLRASESGGPLIRTARNPSFRHPRVAAAGVAVMVDIEGE